jgi:hypothetical protein
MLNKNITKFFGFVISLLLICLIFSGCSLVSSNEKQVKKDNDSQSSSYLEPKIVGKIESSEIKESSGLAASRCQENVFWTHNDSGDEAFIYALDAKGEKLGTWRVSGAENKDWEDMATFQTEKGECFLYIGDIGNNERLKSEMTIYRVREPQVSSEDKSSSRKNPSQTENSEVIKFVYPEIRHDAETLMIHPKTGDIYILAKRVSGASVVYKLKSDIALTKNAPLEKIADFSVPAIPDGLLTGGDISPDGKRIVLCDYFDGYEMVLSENAKNFDEIWEEKPSVIQLGKREQGEAICYSADGNSIFATSEKKNSPMIEVKRK